MSTISRRTALRQVSAGTVAAATLPTGDLLQSLLSSPHAKDAPAIRPVHLPGLHAYAGAHSVAAGDKIHFFVSSSVPYQFSVVRLGPEIDDPTSDVLLHEFGEGPAHSQPIRPGSCIVVPEGLDPTALADAATVECWVRLFRTEGPQGVLTQRRKEDAFGLSLDAEGQVRFDCGATATGSTLEPRRWYHLAGVWDGRAVTLWIDGRQVAQADFRGSLDLRSAPLLIGAAQLDGQIDQLLDGDVAMPAVYRRALSAQQIQQRYDDRGLTPPNGDDVVACWPLDEEAGSTVRDAAGGKYPGKILNHATWMIGGPSFDGTQVPRYRNQYQPQRDGRRGHGIRFAADDLYDCGWEPTHRWRVPDDARSGIYCARAHFELDSQPRVQNVTFIVTRPPHRPAAPIVVLCSTSTWLAYNSTPFAVNRQRGERPNLSTAGGTNSHPLAPTYSCYLNHRAGQPSYQFGLRIPWPSASPEVLYSEPDMSYSHLMRGERFTHVWLDENGYAYDVITDLDLHRQPDLLREYKTIIINGHSEYWSIEAYNGVDRYLRDGGTAIVFSGNTMFWRVSFSDDGSVMECRKFDDRIGGMTHANFGELYHCHDGKRGSLMRECGYPAWAVVGLDCDGWGGVRSEEFGVYRVQAPDHFLFRGPEPVGLAVDDSFGHAPGGDVPKAIGHEWDVRVSRLNAITHQIPDGASLPTEPDGIVTLAHGVRQQTHALDYFTQPTTAPDGIVGEMIYWDRPQGGRVFHGGAIAVGWALSADPHLQKLVRNVLHHFGIEPREPRVR